MVFKRLLNDLSNSSKGTVSKISEVFLSTADSVSGLIGNLPFIATVEAVVTNQSLPPPNNLVFYGYLLTYKVLLA